MSSLIFIIVSQNSIDNNEPVRYNIIRRLVIMMEEYMAGLFDGEGSLYLTQKTGGSLAVKLTNTNRKVIELVVMHWGGNIQTIIPTIKNKLKKPLYRWCVYGRKALPFLYAISPYSIIKKPLIPSAIIIASYAWQRERQNEIEQARQLIRDYYKNNCS